VSGDLTVSDVQGKREESQRVGLEVISLRQIPTPTRLVLIVMNYFVHGPHQQDGDATSGSMARDARPAPDSGRRPTDGSSGARGSYAATRRNDGLSNATISGIVVIYCVRILFSF